MVLHCLYFAQGVAAIALPGSRLRLVMALWYTKPPLAAEAPSSSNMYPGKEKCHQMIKSLLVKNKIYEDGEAARTPISNIAVSV